MGWNEFKSDLPERAQKDPTLMGVMEFHYSFEIFMSARPILPPLDVTLMRVHLTLEEAAEVSLASSNGTIAEVAHELADFQYVLDGTYLSYGVWMNKPGPTDWPRVSHRPDRPTPAPVEYTLAFTKSASKLAAKLCDLADRASDRCHNCTPGDLRLELESQLHQTQMATRTYIQASGLFAPWRSVFGAVHASNMSKLGPDGRPVKSEGGRILKPEGYRPADVAGVLRAWESGRP